MLLRMKIWQKCSDGLCGFPTMHTLKRNAFNVTNCLWCSKITFSLVRNMVTIYLNANLRNRIMSLIFLTVVYLMPNRLSESMASGCFRSKTFPSRRRVHFYCPFVLSTRLWTDGLLLHPFLILDVDVKTAFKLQRQSFLNYLTWKQILKSIMPFTAL